MKLHEEFKLFETMWDEAQDNTSELVTKFVNRRIGFRNYDLTQEADLIDWLKARQRNKETRFDNHSKQVGYIHTDATFKRERAYGILLLKQELLGQAKKLGIDKTPEMQRIKSILDTNPLTKRTGADIDRDFPLEWPVSQPRSAQDVPPRKRKIAFESMQEEASAKIYDLELTAWSRTDNEEYDDADNIGDLAYQFSGTISEIISKLNTIAKTHDFSFVFIFDGDKCVFEASDTDSATDEEFDTPVIWNNEVVPANTPFLKSFK
jgi:hypothetical protein